MSEPHDRDEEFEQELQEEQYEWQEEVSEQEPQEPVEQQEIESEQEPLTDTRGDTEVMKLKDMLARSQADLENFKKRTERDRADTIYFAKSSTFQKILPRVDDLERILENTPDEMRSGTLYEWVSSLYTTLQKDLQGLWVTPFDALGTPLNPDMHEVMTQAPGEEGIVVNVFEKWYMLWDRVLRVAKVVVGNGE